MSRNSFVRIAVVLSLLVVPGLLLAAEKQQRRIHVCDFGVPAAVRQANASFTVIYRLSIGEDGHPRRIERLKNDFLQDGPFTSCFQSWILPVGEENVTVTLSWRHGSGWTDMNISGARFEDEITIRPGACKQYGVSNKPSAKLK